MDRAFPIQSAAEMQGALDALGDGIAVFDKEDRLVFCNTRMRAQYEALGVRLDPGLSWRIFVQEASRRGLGRGFDQIDLHLDTGGGRPLSLDVARPGDRWMRLGVALTEGGGFVLTESDMTEAHRAAELRAEADDLLREVLDACAVNIVMCRIGDGAVLYRNPAFVALFGDLATTRHAYADLAMRSDFLAELLAADAVDGFDVILKRGDGTPFPAQVSARLIDYRGERVVVSSTRDMTQLFAQRDELARQREARFQNEKLTALGELLAGVAHELNNPLSVVVGHALMLQDEVVEPSATERVDKIAAAAERCARIVKTFLSMARQKPARLEPVALNGLVEDVAGVSELGDVLVFDLGPDLPPVLADEDQIAQVMLNLLANASQATETLGQAARIRVRTAAQDDGTVLFEVSDNGPGVPDALRARIFEPFFSTKAEGSGIGLALCHRIVAAHGGALSYAPLPEGGAGFRMVLPMAGSARAADGTVARALPDPAALRALVVEDEPDVAEMLADMLTALGLTVAMAETAEAAIAYLEDGGRADLILSDLRMPGMGGEGLLRQVRQKWPALARRIAFVTGDAMRLDAESLGRPVLEKPVVPQDLRRLVQGIATGGAQP